MVENDERLDKRTPVRVAHHMTVPQCHCPFSDVFLLARWFCCSGDRDFLDAFFFPHVEPGLNMGGQDEAGLACFADADKMPISMLPV